MLAVLNTRYPSSILGVRSIPREHINSKLGADFCSKGMYETRFCCALASLSRLGEIAFLRYSAAGYASGPRVRWAQVGLRPGSVTNALGVKGRNSLLFFAGLVFVESGPSGSTETSNYIYDNDSFPRCFTMLFFLKYHSSNIRLGSHGYNSSSLDKTPAAF